MDRLTLMAVHAHPDDEASSTGGILARYADEGLRTVLVTCTNGELGDGPGGTKPDAAGHDDRRVAQIRRAELEKSCEILKVSNLEMLGYRDSGMAGWPQNQARQAFWNAPLDDAADRLGQLFERYRPQVVVTYDENGLYGHPDHVQAHRVTVAALRRTPIPQKLYYPVVPESAMAGFANALRQAGAEVPEGSSDDFDFATPDELVAARIDCSRWSEAKFRALEAHASQRDNEFFLRLGLDAFTRIFATEFYVRAFDTSNAPLPEDDLFSGLR